MIKYLDKENIQRLIASVANKIIEKVLNDSVKDISTVDLQNDSGKLASIDTVMHAYTATRDIFQGIIKDEEPESFPPDIVKGNFVGIENCTITSPGNKGLGIYDGGSWIIIPFESGISGPEFEFPEPPMGEGNYFRSYHAGDDYGMWIEFTGVNGNTHKINFSVKQKANPADDIYIPLKGEPVYLEDINNFVIGDGTTQLAGLSLMIKDNLYPYTPEDSANKGQAGGYPSLDHNIKIPVMYLPDVLTSSYTKSEVDDLVTAMSMTIQTSVNQEITNRQTGDTFVGSKLETHETNTTLHVTQANKDSWNAKLDTEDIQYLTNHSEDEGIHVTIADKNKWNQQTTAYIVTTENDMYAIPSANLKFGDVCFLKVSAPGEVPVIYRKYNWYGDDGWNAEAETIDIVNMSWAGITGKPNSSPLSIDNAVTVSHKHSNSVLLNQFSQDENGTLTFNGIPIIAPILFFESNTGLPDIGTPNTLYTVIKDSRVSNYTSISLWNNGAYEMIGRGLNDNPPPVGDMSIMQRELFNVTPGSEFSIALTRQGQFAFLPMDILKLVEGAKGVNREYTKFDNPSQYTYNKNVIQMRDGVYVQCNEIPMVLDTVSDRYYFSLDVDISNYHSVAQMY